MCVLYPYVSIPSISFIVIISRISNKKSLFCSVVSRIILNTNDPDGTAFTYLLVSLWSSYILAEQLCITLLLFVRSKINVAIIVSYIFCVSLALASGTVRSFKGLQPWLQENTKATHTRYASTLLHSAVFLSRRMNCTPGGVVTCPLTSEYL